MKANLANVMAATLTAALLGGCGGSQLSTGAPGAMRGAAAYAKFFKFTGHKQMFVVPRNVRVIGVKVLGASGGNSAHQGSYSSAGGNGGRIIATIPVSPGEKLAIFVGGMGAPLIAGFNGGGAGGVGNPSGSNSGGGGGGGASDIRENGDALSDRVIVAGGGGGGGAPGLYDPHNDGGAGGNKNGAPGRSGHAKWDGHGGDGGTQTAGGDGGKGGHLTRQMTGPAGESGALGLGGNGGGNGTDQGGGDGGGGGGGGYYGGGGGGAGSLAASGLGGGGAGGGGSSYVESTAIGVKSQRGAAPPGNGLIMISWEPTY